MVLYLPPRCLFCNIRKLKLTCTDDPPQLYFWLGFHKLFQEPLYISAVCWVQEAVRTFALWLHEVSHVKYTLNLKVKYLTFNFSETRACVGSSWDIFGGSGRDGSWALSLSDPTAATKKVNCISTPKRSCLLRRLKLHRSPSPKA